jgi:hypothetical protein
MYFSASQEHINLATFADQRSVKIRDQYFRAHQQGHHPFTIHKQARHYHLVVINQAIP